MNISELSRILKVPLPELRDILPQVGFDIGKRAIKVDDWVAKKIINSWPDLLRQYKKSKEKTVETEEKKEISQVKEIRIPHYLTVRELSHRLALPVNKVISELMKNGIFASLNEKIDFETASIIAEDLGYLVLLEEENLEESAAEKDIVGEILKQEEKNLVERPPIVVVMGHVDHGKTKLLDAIRKTHIAEGESGGITQHIGAYQVKRKDNLITFIDTPGHEAFTALRSRGAKVADVAILVVAADDSVKPQTIEALKIIQSAKIPYVVAINKIDKDEANLDKVKQDLSQIGLVPEDWGGKAVCVPISAKKETGISDLLDMLLLTVSLEKDKIKANPQGRPIGTIIESHIDKGEGPVATILVRNGTFRKKDVLVSGQSIIGKIRSMKDYRAQNIEEALPATPVKVSGIKILPQVGEIVEVAKDTENYLTKLKKQETFRPTFFESQSLAQDEDENKAVVNLVFKADVLGSLEVITEALEKLENQDVKINIISQGLGNINEADVLRAESAGKSAKTILAGFSVGVQSSAMILAKEKGIEIKIYKVIYSLLDEIKAIIEKEIGAEIVKTILGKVKVLAIFRTEKEKMIIGGKVKEGKIKPTSMAEVWREDNLVGGGKIEQIQSGKLNVKEVEEGQECGVNFLGKPIIKIGDELIIYREEKKKREMKD